MSQWDGKALKRQVLVLNQNYEPLMICNAKRAIILVYLGKAEIVERDEFWVRSVRQAFPLPSIVRLVRYIQRPRKQVVLSRKNILKRDNHRCQYCGASKKPLTVDHVIPKERGGEDSWENLVTACVDCNSKKGNRTPEEANMPLLSRPRRPTYVIFLRRFVGVVDDRWKPYLFMD